MLAPLSPTQRQAVTQVDGHYLVLAGAGSGKTRVITHRIAHLLLNRAVPPYRILAVTFTNKAAREMRERVTDLLNGDSPPNLWVTTFHSLGARLLRLHAEAAGLSRNFSIFDEEDSLRLVKRILKDLGLDPKVHPPGAVRAEISRFKCEMQDPAAAAQAEGGMNRIAVRVYEAYEKELREQDAVDFGDLLVRVVRLLRQDEELRQRYQRRFRYLMVDEYQDTNHVQYRLIRLLAGGGAHVCAVGDEDQSIYGWRGADIRNILDFKSDFPGTQVLQLDQNYRCTQPVLEAANAMIRNNRSRLKEREVFTRKQSPHRVGYYQAWSSDQEAAYVTEAVRYLKLEEDLEFSDFAVFYRTHAQARALETALLRARVPYRVFGGPGFYDRAVVKDLVAYLRLLVNARDREALSRVVNVPKRGIGAKGLGKLLNHAIRTGTPARDLLADPRVIGGKGGKQAAAMHQVLDELLEGVEERLPHQTLAALIDRIGYEGHVLASKKPEDMELVQELQNAVVDYERQSEAPSLRGFLEDAALLGATDELDLSQGSVSLMTLHNAKGLEFPVVFVTGLEEGLLPHANSEGLEDRLEEERRLFYVGMTRAKVRLFLTSARNRTMYGKSTPRLPSSFLGEIGAEHLQTSDADVFDELEDDLVTVYDDF